MAQVSQRLRVGRILLVAASAASVVLAAQAPAGVVGTTYGQSGGLTWTPDQIDARYALYRERLNELHAADTPQAKVDETIAREFQILPLRGGLPTAAPMRAATTDASNVTLYTPSFGYDSLLRKYVMSASWVWKSCGSTGACWTKDQVKTGNVGGQDGMAIKINRPIFRDSAGISTSNNCGAAAYSNNQPDTDTGYGVAFIEQDKITGTDLGSACAGTAARYNWHRGTVSETFHFQNANCGGVQLQVDSKFGHDWSTTNLNSIGISTTGISFGWSSSSYRFNAIPSTPYYGYC